MIHRLNSCVGKAALVVALAMFCQLAVAALPDFTELVENNHKSVVNISFFESFWKSSPPVFAISSLILTHSVPVLSYPKTDTF